MASARRDIDVCGRRPTYGGGASNAFVTKIDARGTALVDSTFLGGSGEDEGTAIAVDRAGSAYVTGHATSPDFPAAGPRRADAPRGGNANAFVSKLNMAGGLRTAPTRSPSTMWAARTSPAARPCPTSGPSAPFSRRWQAQATPS
jgi:hypothetical protein